MPVYQWVGKNRKDEVQKGEIDAVSEEAVKAQLARQRITPTKVKKKTQRPLRECHLSSTHGQTAGCDTFCQTVFNHDRCRTAHHSMS